MKTKKLAPIDHSVHEDFGPHTGKTISVRRFESYAPMQSSATMSGLASGMRTGIDREAIKQKIEDEKDPEYAEKKRHWMKYFGLPVEETTTGSSWHYDPNPSSFWIDTEGKTLNLPVLETMVGSLAMPAKDALKALGYDDPEKL